MNPEQLLAHFDRISAAPDAVSRLRRFILDLAVRGKLVEQDPRDEPASELLKRIQAEKDGLIDEGVIKAHGPVATISGDEEPYQVPAGWEWARFIEIAAIQSNLVNPCDYRKSPHIAPDNIESGTGRLLPYETIGASAVFSAKHLFFAGCILYSKIRPALAKASVMDFDGLCSADMYPILPLLNRLYLHRFMLSQVFVNQAISEDNRVAMPKINQASLSKILVAVPPLAEQQRIVAKVDELMALCDRLEAAQAERESRRDRLVASSLSRLNNDADSDAFREHARFHFHHLPRLTTKPAHIQQLRQTILNLAVRGKLVTPDLDDRPVRVMGRKEISLSRDYDDHVFNESLSALNLPSSWGVEPLARVVAAIVDCPHSTPKWANKGRICVRTNQFRPGSLDLSESRYVSEETYVDRIQRLEPTHNDILYSREGGILGVACRIPPGVKLCLGQRMMLIRVGEATTAQFLEMVLNSPFITTIARTRTTGGAAPRVNVATIKAYPIPLPPLAEQQRIVAKVDELMALCDRLEAQLTTTHTESRHLLEAVLHEALKPAITQ